MQQNPSAQASSVVAKFLDKSLPKAEWTHQAHLMVGIWHNMNMGFDEALRLVRHGIQEYNTVIGIENSDYSGYHETLTIFWMMIIRAFLQSQSFRSPDEAYDHFIKRDQSSKDYPLTYYSKELLFSVKARKEWVDGDLKKLSSSQITHRVRHINISKNKGTGVNE